ncbi:MAG: M28 family peptidase, partial [bacterium]|nr:M28 family peptidase [bacterium]
MRWRRLATPVIGRKVSARGRWIARGAAAGLLPAVFLIGSIVMTWMPGHSYRGALSPLTPGETALAGRLEAHVRALADAPERGGIGERNLVCAPEALEAAARYIEAAFAAADLAPVAQPFAVGDHAVRNIVAEIRGAARPDEILLIGAHYDSAPGTPGANDNATGVAALI